MLCCFHVYSKVNQFYMHTRAHTHTRTHTGLLFFKFFHCTGHYRVLSRVPYSTIYMSIPISQFILLPFSPVTIYFLYPWFYFCFVGFPDDSAVKKSACNTGDAGSILGSGRSPGGGHGNPLQYSCQENPIDRGAWWATVYGVSKSQIQLKGLNTHAHISVL